MVLGSGSPLVDASLKWDSSGPRPDGQKTEEILGRFRNDFTHDVLHAIVHRVGAMAVSSGLSCSSTISNASDKSDKLSDAF